MNLTNPSPRPCNVNNKLICASGPIPSGTKKASHLSVRQLVEGFVGQVDVILSLTVVASVADRGDDYVAVVLYTDLASADRVGIWIRCGAGESVEQTVRDGRN